MFGPGGHFYVFFTYGMHYCLNVVTGLVGTPEAVLIRALEPLEGIAVMRERRRASNDYDLCSGPAKLVQALGVSITDNSSPINEASGLWIEEDEINLPVSVGPRIGISRATNAQLRFWATASPYVSKPPRQAVQ